MPIEMPSGLPFSVDTWTPSAMKKRHHFLTHAHTDHTMGISTHYSYPIYSTRLTQTLVLHHFPQLDESLFVSIEVGESLTIDEPDNSFCVTAFDANHCPGALMFLFEGDFGNILHTGDSRLTSECLHSLPEKYIGKRGKGPRCELDYVFLDCTFGQFTLNMPTKYSAVRQVINCIWKHPDARVVYLSCDLLGQEDILVSVSKTFGSKVFVDKEKTPDYFRALTVTAPQVVSEDPSSRFHVLEGFPKLCERAKAMLAEAKANSHPEPLIIRPSTQWFVHDKSLLYVDGKGRERRSSEAVRDPFGVWHICYSMHSSREELEWALQLLAPKWVVSTTPSCKAMELTYVKKNCFPKQLSPKDPVWKLLGINPKDFPSIDISSQKVVTFSSMVEDSHESEVVESQIELIETSIDDKKPLIISPPRKKTPVTLFGRARLGIEDFAFIGEKEKTILEKDRFSFDEVLFESNSENSKEPKTDIKEKCSKSMVEDERNIREKFEKSMDDFSHVRIADERKSRTDAYTRNGSSNVGFSDRFRKMYRMMNVPVPEPLPSLVELMKARKRAKRDYNL